MAIIARLGVNIAANIGFQYAAEMLPTVVRAQGVSLIHIIGYVAHILGPYIIYLVSESKFLWPRSQYYFNDQRDGLLFQCIINILCLIIWIIWISFNQRKRRILSNYEKSRYSLFILFLCTLSRFSKIQTCTWEWFNFLELIGTICLEGNINEKKVFHSI